MSHVPYTRGPATRKQRVWNDRPMGPSPPRRLVAPPLAPPQRSWWVDAPHEQFTQQAKGQRRREEKS